MPESHSCYAADWIYMISPLYQAAPSPPTLPMMFLSHPLSVWLSIPKCVLVTKFPIPDRSEGPSSLLTGPSFHMRSKPPTLFSLPVSLGVQRGKGHAVGETLRQDRSLPPEPGAWQLFNRATLTSSEALFTVNNVLLICSFWFKICSPPQPRDSPTLDMALYSFHWRQC